MSALLAIAAALVLRGASLWAVHRDLPASMRSTVRYTPPGGSNEGFGRAEVAMRPAAEWAQEMAAWRGMRGITHLSVHTVGLGLTTPAAHVEMLERFKKEALGQFGS